VTLFEYLAIAFSLLYSIAALRLLGGLPAAMDPERRDALHLSLTMVLLGVVALSFWTFWSLRGVDWTFQGFLLALAVPGLLYYCAALIIPENPADVPSWRDHYFAIRRRWYGALALWGLAAGVSASVNLGMPLQHRARGVHVTSVLIGLVGFASPKRRVHVVLVSLLVLFSISAALNPGFGPSWLAQP
jgi:hypothetical protein